MRLSDRATERPPDRKPRALSSFRDGRSCYPWRLFPLDGLTTYIPSVRYHKIDMAQIWFIQRYFSSFCGVLCTMFQRRRVRAVFNPRPVCCGPYPLLLFPCSCRRQRTHPEKEENCQIKRSRGERQTKEITITRPKAETPVHAATEIFLAIHTLQEPPPFLEVVFFFLFSFLLIPGLYFWAKNQYLLVSVSIRVLRQGEVGVKTYCAAYCTSNFSGRPAHVAGALPPTVETR